MSAIALGEFRSNGTRQKRATVDKNFMARIAGVNLPNDKKVDVALTYLYGIGLTLSLKILEEMKIDRKKISR
jgi:hypothetical protein